MKFLSVLVLSALCIFCSTEVNANDNWLSIRAELKEGGTFATDTFYNNSTIKDISWGAELITIEGGYWLIQPHFLCKIGDGLFGGVKLQIDSINQTSVAVGFSYDNEIIKNYFFSTTIFQYFDAGNLFDFWLKFQKKFENNIQLGMEMGYYNRYSDVWYLRPVRLSYEVENFIPFLLLYKIESLTPFLMYQREWSNTELIDSLMLGIEISF